MIFSCFCFGDVAAPLSQTAAFHYTGDGDNYLPLPNPPRTQGGSRLLTQAPSPSSVGQGASWRRRRINCHIDILFCLARRAIYASHT
jgi:hypothetical protein